MNKKVVLMILDGWGHGTKPEVSAIHKANTPFMDSVYDKYANSELQASGLAVGLPDGQMGNSEVGHMNIGAGRIVYQDLVKINKAVEEKTLANESTLTDALKYAKDNGKKVHFLGLLSDGGVHSHINHLKGLLDLTAEMGVDNSFVHVFTDGRDCDPNSGKGFVADIESYAASKGSNVASVIGRYYSMDRDKRWERVKLAYDLLVNGEGEKSTNLVGSVQASYDQGVTDEFIKPIVKVDESGNPVAVIEEGDVVIFYNFRTDRGREMTIALTQEMFHEQNMHPMDLYYVTLTNYDDTFKNIKVVFDKDNLQNTIGEVLEASSKKQIRIAETEKYPHVTFFFSGGREEPFDGEDRLLCPSPKVATYDLQPEMSANDIRDKIVAELNKQEADFVCLNFANPDMVGHTGVFEAAVKACETVDKCASDVVNASLHNGYSVIIIADHGNSDFMINDDGSPHTAHTTNLVPCVLVDNEYSGGLKDGKLGDVSPTILELMGIEKPADMTGESLLV